MGRCREVGVEEAGDRPGADGLSAGAETPRAAMMCAEAVWWKCHRQLIADALVAGGVEVRHISSATAAPLHTLTAFARVLDERVTYSRYVLTAFRPTTCAVLGFFL